MNEHRVIADGQDGLRERSGGLSISPEDPVDILSWIPFRLGFWPIESVVVVALRRDGTRLRVGLTARFDISDVDEDHRVRAELERQLILEQADAAWCVIATADSDERTLRGASAAARVLQWWLACPWSDPTMTWLLGQSRFRCVVCSQPRCCSPDGQPKELLLHSAVSAELVVRGYSIVDSRHELVRGIEAAARGRGAASAAALRHARRREAGDQSRWRRDVMGRWVDLARLLGARPALTDRTGTDGARAGALTPTLIGAVLAGLSDEWVRDGVLLWAGTGRVIDDRERTRALAELFGGSLRPDPERLVIVDQVIVTLATHATKPWRVPVLSTAAWLAWWGGDGVRAGLLLERSARLDPDYPLTKLLTAVVGGGVPPGWARDQHAA